MQRKLLITAMLLASGAVWAAADEPVQPATSAIPASDGRAPNDAIGIKLGPGLRASASVGLESIYNSNFFLQESNPKSSFGFVLTPNVVVKRKAKKWTYELGAALETAKYTGIDQGPSTYLDTKFNGNFYWDAETRHHISGDFYSKYGHDPFGSFRTENGFNVAQGLDKWWESAGHLRYRFGAHGALINLESELGLLGRRYATNRDQTNILDYRQWTARETAFFNISSKTALLAEVFHLNNGYYTEIPNFPGRDSQENHYRVGFHWLATGTTSGDVRIGKYRREYDNPQVPRVSATDWAASLSWAPLVYSVFTFQSGVESQRSYLAGVPLIENRFETVDWTHEWSYRLRTRLAYSHINSEFVGSSRLDTIDTVGAETNYLSSLRWMWLGGVSYSHRNSNQTGRDYDDTLVYLGVRYTR